MALAKWAGLAVTALLSGIGRSPRLQCRLGVPKESHLAKLRRDHRWSFEELLSRSRAAGGPQTMVLIDGPLYASNVGCVLRQAAVLQPPGAEDALSALLLAASEPSRLTHTAVFPSERFLKNAVRISLAERQLLPQRTRMVTLPEPEQATMALEALRREGFVLVALENLEACDGESEPLALWAAPLSAERVLFVAGGENHSLRPELLALCDVQCFIPSASCPLTPGTGWDGDETHNPSLNLAHAVVIALYERRRQLCS
ncbi:unnamed protein product [Effrenium voratum]|uniref:Uncharacterized protein n=1 Tax=Effrenium voratum TaxID=2562239 RepID=A0AA36J889_9DINO|nr:unnamed protein product [Effrenium voratum]CAJ1401006.1 unnamed protein product [Effrenium voratum]CAJ1461673.1 unnamed protein product [Effrenium voratum]